MHEINRFRSPELLVCLLCLNEFSSHDIVLHTKLDVKAFPVLLFLTNRLLGTIQQNLKFKAIKLRDFKMDLIKW